MKSAKLKNTIGIHSFVGWAKNAQYNYHNGNVPWKPMVEGSIRKTSCPGVPMDGARCRVLEVKDGIATVVLLQPSMPAGSHAPHGTIYKLNCAEYLTLFGYQYKDIDPELQFPDQEAVEPILDTLVPQFDTIEKFNKRVESTKANYEALQRAHKKRDRCFQMGRPS